MTLRTDTYDPQKWQLIPKKMTYEMRNVVWMGDGDWRELLAVAPEPPAQQPMRFDVAYSLLRQQDAQHDGLRDDSWALQIIRAIERQHGIFGGSE